MDSIKKTEELSFASLFSSWPWREIPNCPGRYVLRSQYRRLSLEELLGNMSLVSSTHHTPHARDEVIVTLIEGGGIISYHNTDGSYVHTLNTNSGFERKLAQLAIAILPHDQ